MVQSVKLLPYMHEELRLTPPPGSTYKARQECDPSICGVDGDRHNPEGLSPGQSSQTTLFEETELGRSLGSMPSVDLHRQVSASLHTHTSMCTPHR